VVFNFLLMWSHGRQNQETLKLFHTDVYYSVLKWLHAVRSCFIDQGRSIYFQGRAHVNLKTRCSGKQVDLEAPSKVSYITRNYMSLFMNQQLTPFFSKPFTFLTPTRFGVCLHHLQGVPDCFLFQHIKMI
jgi:hypothetical protein